jgi:hypothetical protein
VLPGSCCDVQSASAAVGSTRAGKTEPQAEQQLSTAAYPMFATVEVTESIESFDGQSQHGQEPTDQQTVGMMMTNMLEAVTAGRVEDWRRDGEDGGVGPLLTMDYTVSTGNDVEWEVLF